nr:MAG TPA: hypothetical protein [Caudoviricetes sp.]
MSTIQFVKAPFLFAHFKLIISTIQQLLLFFLILFLT